MPVGKDFVIDEYGFGDPILGDNLFRGAPVVIDVPHHELHCGDSYACFTTSDLANGAIDEYVISVPDGEGASEWFRQDNKLWHFKYLFDCEAEMLIQWYKDPSFSGGTPLTSFNRNFNSENVDFLDILYGPTVSDPGTLVGAKRLGSGNKVGGDAGDRATEFILENNADYLLRITNATTVNNYYNLELDYYVHPGV